MELTIERYRVNKDYTLGRIYETGRKRNFCIDILEPPISGLSDNELVTLNPGRYKVFLKTDKEECNMVACLQRVNRRNRFGFSPLVQDDHPSEVSFKSPNKVFTTSMLLGRYSVSTDQMVPDIEKFNLFMMRLIIAKQNKEIIYVCIK